MHRELTRDHDGLRVAMREFAHLMERARPDDMPEIARQRIAFSQAFRAHMGQEDALLQAIRQRPMTPQAAQVMRDHSRATVALFLRYSDHVKDWNPAQIAQDWRGYRDAVLTLQNGLHDRMDWEETHLHPLFSGSALKAA